MIIMIKQDYYNIVVECVIQNKEKQKIQNTNK